MRAKKSLGQNFLKSKKVLSDIIVAGSVSASDTVLEIGPGKGALTRALLDTGARVVAIEKDIDMIDILSKAFEKEIASRQLKLIHADILNINLESKLAPGTWKLVANIPYYITGAIIEQFLTGSIQPLLMVLLVQKEVADRIVARDGKESILSLSVKAFGTPKKICNVPAKYFSPAPDVDSAVIRISDISRDRLNARDEQRFFEIVKRGFSQKRKQLVGTLPPLIAKEKLVAFLESKKLPLTARPEELSINTWLELSKI